MTKNKEEDILTPKANKNKHNKYTLTLKPMVDGVYENVLAMDLATFNEEEKARFGVNTISYRMFPDIRDGLKPIGRRLIYSAYLVSELKKVKSNGIIGELLKKFHPHGDLAAYSSMVKLTQPWRGIPLIKGESNFGSVNDPNTYAAMRYTEALLSPFSKDCYFSDFRYKKDTCITDFIPNFDDSDLEPFYLPAKYPVVLTRWSTGVVVGFNNVTPAFSFRDACNAIIKLIEDGPNAELNYNLDDHQGCDILCERGVKNNFFDTVDPKVRVRSKYTVETNKGKNSLVISTLPFETSVVSIDNILEKRIKEKAITYVEDSEDSVENFTELKYRIFLSKGYDPHTCMEDLFKKTPLEKTFSTKLHFLNDLQLKDYGTFRSIALDWLEYRRQQVKRKCKLLRSHYAKEMHIQSGLLKLIELNKVDEFFKLLQKHKKAEGIEIIKEKYGLDNLQAKYLYDVRAHTFSIDSKAQFLKNIEEFKKEIERLSKIIKSNKKVDKIIVKELQEGIDKYGEPNKSKIHLIGGAIEKVSSATIEMTNKHLLKYTKDIQTINDDTPIVKQVVPNTSLLVFNDKGKFVNVNLGKLKESKNNSVGYSLKEMGLESDAIGMIPETPKGSIVMITKDGTIQRSSVSSYNSSKTGSAIKLRDDDKLVGVTAGIASESVIIYTNMGNALLLPIKDISKTNRNTIGVIGIKLADGEECIGITKIDKHHTHLVTLTDRGYMKKFAIGNLPKSVRGKKGFQVLATDEVGKFISVIGISPDSILTLFTDFNSDDIEFESKSIPKKTRLSKGDKVIKMDRGIKATALKER